jgi:hypothetical protein
MTSSAYKFEVLHYSELKNVIQTIQQLTFDFFFLI